MGLTDLPLAPRDLDIVIEGIRDAYERRDEIARKWRSTIDPANLDEDERAALALVLLVEALGTAAGSVATGVQVIERLVRDRDEALLDVAAHDELRREHLAEVGRMATAVADLVDLGSETLDELRRLERSGLWGLRKRIGALRERLQRGLDGDRGDRATEQLAGLATQILSGEATP
jgi:hypothetical protein